MNVSSYHGANAPLRRPVYQVTLIKKRGESVAIPCLSCHCEPKAWQSLASLVIASRRRGNLTKPFGIASSPSLGSGLRLMMLLAMTRGFVPRNDTEKRRGTLNGVPAKTKFFLGA